MDQTEADSRTRNGSCAKRTCLGLKESSRRDSENILAAPKLGGSSACLGTTSAPSSAGSTNHQQPPQVSPALNGRTLFAEMPSTLIKCSQHYTSSYLLKRTLDVWDRLPSLSDETNPVETGSQLGARPPKRPRLSSRTETTNSGTMETTSPENSPQRSHTLTGKLSCTTQQSGKWWEGDKACCSPTTTGSPTFTRPSYWRTTSNPTLDDQGKAHQVLEPDHGIACPASASTSTLPTALTGTHASTSTSVDDANKSQDKLNKLKLNP